MSQNNWIIVDNPDNDELLVVEVSETESILSEPEDNPSDVIEVAEAGPQGIKGDKGDSGISGFVHNQASASFTWTINHNLGYVPAITVFNSGSQEVDAAISHPTVNQAVVSLTVSTSGFARLL